MQNCRFMAANEVKMVVNGELTFPRLAANGGLKFSQYGGVQDYGGIIKSSC